ncbi:MAG: hypothetical protein NVSMB65_10670 [Chloroflexota bacterium]
MQRRGGVRLEPFPSHAVLSGRYLDTTGGAGLGIDIAEKAARLLGGAGSIRAHDTAEDRRTDGTVVRP